MKEKSIETPGLSRSPKIIEDKGLNNAKIVSRRTFKNNQDQFRKLTQSNKKKQKMNQSYFSEELSSRILPSGFLDDSALETISKRKEAQHDAEAHLFDHVDEGVKCQINMVHVLNYKSISTCVQKSAWISGALEFKSGISPPQTGQIEEIFFGEDQILSGVFSKESQNLETIQVDVSMEPISFSMLSMINGINFPEPEEYSLQTQIDVAPPYSTVLLPPSRITVSSLVIWKPLILQGQTYTSLFVSEKITIRLDPGFLSSPKPIVKLVELNVTYLGLTTSEIKGQGTRLNGSQPKTGNLFRIEGPCCFELENCLVESQIKANIQRENYHKKLDEYGEEKKQKEENRISKGKDTKSPEELINDEELIIGIKIVELKHQRPKGKVTIRSSVMRSFFCFIVSRSEFEFELMDSHFEGSTGHAVSLSNPARLAIKSVNFIKSGLSSLFILLSSTKFDQKAQDRLITCENSYFVFGGMSGVSIVGQEQAQIPVAISISNSVFVKFDKSAIDIQNFQGKSLEIKSNEIKMNKGSGISLANVQTPKDPLLALVSSNKIFKNDSGSGILIQNSSGKLESNEIYENKEGMKVVCRDKATYNDNYSSSTKKPILSQNALAPPNRKTPSRNNNERSSPLEKPAAFFEKSANFGLKSKQMTENKTENDLLSSLPLESTNSEVQTSYSLLLEKNEVFSNLRAGLDLDYQSPFQIEVKDSSFSSNQCGVKINEVSNDSLGAALCTPKSLANSNREALPRFSSKTEFQNCQVSDNESFGFIIQNALGPIQLFNVRISGNKKGAVFASEKSHAEKLKIARKGKKKWSGAFEAKGPWGRLLIQKEKKGPCYSNCKIF